MKIDIIVWKASLICSLTLVAAMGVLTGCDSSIEGSLPPRDQLHYPVGLTFHPDGQYFYVVNSNFDARYRPNAGGSVSVIDANTLEIRDAHSPYLPSFGSNIVLNDDATRAYVTARAQNSVVAFNVASDGSALYCNDSQGQATSNPAACIINPALEKNASATVPDDPFDLAVFSVDRPEVGTVDVVNLAHLAGTQVSSIALPGRDLSGANIQSAPLLRGASAITQRPGTRDLYVAGRRTNQIAIYQPYINDLGKVEALLARGSFALNNEAEMIDARAIVFEDDGQRFYVLSRNPNALYIVDVVPADPATGAGRAHRIVGSIPLRSQPGGMALHTTPQGQRLAYITSAQDRSIQVLDLESRTILDEILLSAEPYDIVIEPRISGCATAEQRCRAFVTLFSDTPKSDQKCSDAGGGCGSVAVIDINPLHRDTELPELSRYHSVIKKIY
ncbi:hypothetical protein [Bradymonas sediminis]|nr:hypothetical protein [Bradymonas sediminis]TDP62638.1 hypothetical protein DFR33_11243 [Bradymonas sediminis]